VPSIFEVGALLESAKLDLIAKVGHGEWIKMIKEDLPFTRQTTNKLMKVAACEHLRNDAHVRHLPANWGTLYELTKLTPEQFEDGIKSGAIHPKMQRKDVMTLRGIEPKPKPRKKNDIPSKSMIEPRIHCLMRTRSLILQWVDVVPKEQWPQLIADLHDQVTDIEQVMKKRGQDGHNSTRESA
jgi:hypothetical protein